MNVELSRKVEHFIIISSENSLQELRTLLEDRHPPLTPATQMVTEFGTVSKFEPRAWNSKSEPPRSDV